MNTRYNTGSGYVILDSESRIIESSQGLVKGSKITKDFIKFCGCKKQRQSKQVFANGSRTGQRFI